jgi:hypothetical protein
MKYKIQIRFNTECTDGESYWRAIVNGEETCVKNIYVNVPTKTTRDYIENKNIFKWHVSCESDDIEFINGELFIK